MQLHILEKLSLCLWAASWSCVSVPPQNGSTYWIQYGLHSVDWERHQRKRCQPESLSGACILRCRDAVTGWYFTGDRAALAQLLWRNLPASEQPGRFGWSTGCRRQKCGPSGTSIHVELWITARTFRKS